MISDKDKLEALKLKWTRRFEFKFLTAIGTDDPERAILPALIWIHKKQQSGRPYHIRIVAFGWWAWGAEIKLTSIGRPA